MTFTLSWGAPIHFGQWHFTPNLQPKIIQHPQDSCAFLCTAHLSNKSLLGTATVQSCSEAVRWSPQPLSKLGCEQAWSTLFLFNTDIWKFFLQYYDFLCKLPSDPYILCWHKLWKSAASLYGCRCSISSKRFQLSLLLSSFHLFLLTFSPNFTISPISLYKFQAWSQISSDLTHSMQAEHWQLSRMWVEALWEDPRCSSQ